MTKKRIILVSVVCFSITVFTVQTLSQVTTRPPRLRDMKGMTREERKEEHRKAMKEWQFQRRQQERERSKEYINLMAREAWKRLLRVTERQWKIIEPKYKKVRDLWYESLVGAGSGGRNEESFHWNRPSEGNYGPMKGKARDQMPEGYRIVEELIDLLENENSKEEEIKQKIDALQQAREKARKALTKARKELKEVITTPRQEAVFLVTGFID